MGVPKVLADLRARVGSIDPEKPVVGILAFEAAAVMSRFISLHRSLAEDEVRRLRIDMRSQGVAYLTSKDQPFLLRLACAELVAELDKAVAAVSRLAAKCQDPLLRGFDRIYDGLKAGGACPVLRGGRVAELERFGLGSTAKGVEKRIKRMERYVAATSLLYAEMEALNELEASERRMEQQWRRYSGPIPVQKPGVSPAPSPIQLELRSQRHKVRRLKKFSLWNKTFDEAVDFMVRAVITVFARISAVFGPCVLGLPPLPDRSHPTLMLRGSPDFPCKHSSGPLERPPAKDVPILRNSAPMFMTKESLGNPFASLSNLLQAGPNTVGGSGLVSRYANVIVAAEKLLMTRSVEGHTAKNDEMEEDAAAREELYHMLPSGMRAAVRAKLRECWRREGGTVDGSLAEGWKEAVGRILSWLGPVAHDTLRWQEERNIERHHRFHTRPRALLLQTLNFSDREKTEAAIVEVLVGLSCMCWYEDWGREPLRF
ncbi:hypothetical protein GW17_00021922 [Ensete ventricosum]|nr:hypothetical protein GW17_00021922 [Ensete ventricosum]